MHPDTPYYPPLTAEQRQQARERVAEAERVERVRDAAPALLAACKLGSTIVFPPARSSAEYKLWEQWRDATEAAIAKADPDNTEN